MNEDLMQKYCQKLNKVFLSMKKDKIDLTTYCAIAHRFASTSLANVLVNIPDHAYLTALGEVMTEAEKITRDFKNNLKKT